MDRYAQRPFASMLIASRNPKGARSDLASLRRSSPTRVRGLAISGAIVDTRIVASTGLRRKALTILAAAAGMISLPVLCFTLRSIGPASRVVFYAYLPFEELAILVVAAVLGAGLGAQAPRWLHLVPPPAAPRRWPRLFLIGLGLSMGWIGLTQLRAFPASATVAEREAWARANVPQYLALRRVIAAVPEVQRDVGRIVAIAPTATDKHRSAREMNGDDMYFSLDVIGDRGAGIFHVDCTLDEWRIYDWRSGRWVFRGRESRIDSVSDQVPHARVFDPWSSTASAVARDMERRITGRGGGPRRVLRSRIGAGLEARLRESSEMPRVLPRCGAADPRLGRC
jgi:hypothetical protein